MKKFYTILFLFSALLWAACSNDAIEIEDSSFQQFHLRVTTEELYDKFSIKTSLMQQMLTRDKNYNIGVISLVYDQNGDFVDSVCTYMKTFSPIDQILKIKEGSNTIITIETLVDTSNDCKSPFWQITDMGKLSTVYLKNSNGTKFWYGAIGLHSQNVSSNSARELAISPSPVGCIVDVRYFNLDATDNDFCAFFTKNAPTGYRLDPSLSQQEHLIYDQYTAKNTWVRRGFVSNQGGTLKNEISHTIYLLESSRLQWCMSATKIASDGSISFTAYPSNSSYFDFKAGSAYYAGLYYTGSGYAAFLGSYSDYRTWLENAKNTAIADVTLYSEPYLVWGASVSTVKSNMSSYTLVTDVTYSEDSKTYFIQYSGKKKEELIEYDFQTSTGDLSDVYVLLSEEGITIEDIQKHMEANGYIYSGYNTEYETYGFNKNDIYAIAYIQDDDWIINYYDQSAYTSVKAQAPRRKLLKRS